jgi:hypothetical protein
MNSTKKQKSTWQRAIQEKIEAQTPEAIDVTTDQEAGTIHAFRRAKWYLETTIGHKTVAEVLATTESQRDALCEVLKTTDLDGSSALTPEGRERIKGEIMAMNTVNAFLRSEKRTQEKAQWGIDNSEEGREDRAMDAVMRNFDKILGKGHEARTGYLTALKQGKISELGEHAENAMKAEHTAAIIAAIDDKLSLREITTTQQIAEHIDMEILGSEEALENTTDPMTKAIATANLNAGHELRNKVKLVRDFYGL